MLGYKYKEVIQFRRLCISAYMGWWAVASSRMVLLGQPCCSSLVSTWFCQKPQISSCGRDCLIYDFPESFHTPEMRPEGSVLIFFLFKVDSPDRLFSIRSVIFISAFSLPSPMLLVMSAYVESFFLKKIIFTYILHSLVFCCECWVSWN